MDRSMTDAAISRATSRPRAAARSLSGAAFPWLLPTVLVLGLFYLYPILDAFRLAFTDQTLLGGEAGYSLDKMVQILSDPTLPFALWITLVFTLGSVAGQQFLGLFIAIVVIRAEKRRLFGATLLRTVVMVAWVVPGVAGGIVWQMLFSEAPFGAINGLLRLAGIAPVAWLSDPHMAIVSVIIANVWRGTAFSMVVMYAALKSIDPVLYEAAAVDGAGPTQRLWYVTLPQLRVAILVNMVIITIQTLNTFDAILSLTGGGPGRATEVLSLFTYNLVFRNFDLAGGSVLSVIMLVISLCLAVVYARFLPQETAE